MSRLRPLLQSSTDDLERDLLRAVLRDAPAGNGLRDTALALGLSVSVANALADGLTQASAQAPAAALPAAANAVNAAHLATSNVALSGGALGASASGAGLGAPATLLMIGKYLAGGALVSLFALAGIEATNPDRPSFASNTASSSARAPLRPLANVARARPMPEPSATAEVPAEPAAEAPAPAQAEPTARPFAQAATKNRRPSEGESKLRALGVSSPVREAPTAASASAPPTSVTSASAPDDSATNSPSLAAEIQLIDRARAALAAGNLVVLRQLLNQYAASGPSGTLAQEAALLEVQLLLKQGDRRAAAALARAIIRQHPGSSHAASLQQLAGE